MIVRVAAICGSFGISHRIAEADERSGLFERVLFRHHWPITKHSQVQVFHFEEEEEEEGYTYRKI